MERTHFKACYINLWIKDHLKKEAYFSSKLQYEAMHAGFYSTNLNNYRNNNSWDIFFTPLINVIQCTYAAFSDKSKIFRTTEVGALKAQNSLIDVLMQINCVYCIFFFHKSKLKVGIIYTIVNKAVITANSISFYA